MGEPLVHLRRDDPLRGRLGRRRRDVLRNVSAKPVQVVVRGKHDGAAEGKRQAGSSLLLESAGQERGGRFQVGSGKPHYITLHQSVGFQVVPGRTCTFWEETCSEG